MATGGPRSIFSLIRHQSGIFPLAGLAWVASSKCHLAMWDFLAYYANALQYAVVRLIGKCDTLLNTAEPPD